MGIIPGWLLSWVIDVEISTQWLKTISHEGALYPHIPQELVHRPVVAQLRFLVNAQDDIHSNKYSHFFSSGEIPFHVWFVCLCCAYRLVSDARQSKKEGPQKRLKKSSVVAFGSSWLTGPGISVNRAVLMGWRLLHHLVPIVALTAAA